MLAELIALQGRFWLLQSAAVLGFIGLCFVEGVLTKRSIHDKPPPELVTDSMYWFLSPYFRWLSNGLVALILLTVARLLGREDAPSLVAGFGPLARQPLALILVEAVVVSDLASYGAHRALHRVPWLWRFHAIHHSAKTVRWSTIARVHPVNELLNYAVGLLPCLAIGLPLRAVLSILPALMGWAMLVHSDFRLSYGRLGALWVSPIFHRWHHTHTNEGGDHNFANVFSLWDKLFGSYYLPLDRKPEIFGLDHDEVPETFLGQLLYPLGSGKPNEPKPELPQAQVQAVFEPERLRRSVRPRVDCPPATMFEPLPIADTHDSSV